MKKTRSNRGPHAKVRQIDRTVTAVETPEGAGATVRRLFPNKYLTHFDPFVLLDDFSIRPPAGFPDHPHGGFEAITYMLEGGFHHVDNLGNDKIIMAGGLQKFTAGKGIVHSELPGTHGLNRGLQLWIRLPSRLRDAEPDYQQVEAVDVPERPLDSFSVRVIAGEESPVKLHTKITYLDVDLRPRRNFAWSTEPETNVLLYLLKGELVVDHSQVNRGEAALLTNGDTVEAKAVDEARFVMLSGKPHNEPIILRGSFVY
jgi:redox-sensitive bicupin YhaK (pirin superfamily)